MIEPQLVSIHVGSSERQQIEMGFCYSGRTFDDILAKVEEQAKNLRQDSTTVVVDVKWGNIFYYYKHLCLTIFVTKIC